MNHNGFTPVQLVTGQLPNLPTVFNSNLPALDLPECKDNILYIQAMNLARQAYVSAESSERVKRALRHPVRVSEEIFSHKDKVFYKRDDSNRWRGPATVIGQDGKIVFIRHGSRLLRVALCRIVRVKDSNISDNVENAGNIAPNANTNAPSTFENNANDIQIDSDTDSDNLGFDSADGGDIN